MSDDFAISSAIIRLMQGVCYQEDDETTWHTLQRSPGPVRDHFRAIGVDLVIDDVEGYAYLRSTPDVEGEPTLPRLIHRRSLSYPVSLLLVLLRKRLVEFETVGGEGRLVLDRDQLTEMLRIFQRDTTNDAALADQAERAIRRVAEFGFLRQLKGESDKWEVRRILKAYVDAHTLGEFDTMLNHYAGQFADD